MAKNMVDSGEQLVVYDPVPANVDRCTPASTPNTLCPDRSTASLPSTAVRARVAVHRGGWQAGSGRGDAGGVGGAGSSGSEPDSDGAAQ